MAARFAGCEPAEVAVTVDGPGLETQWQKALDLDLWMVAGGHSETLAAALLGACRERAADPVVRALFTSIAGDEIHHARLGGHDLAWRAPQWSQAERQRVADHSGNIVAGVERQFWNGRDIARCTVPPRALSACSIPKLSAATIRQVMEDEIVPGLERARTGSIARMAKAAARQVTFPWATPAPSAPEKTRAGLAARLRALTGWQASLSKWPAPRDEPNVIPFVSLYLRGQLIDVRGQRHAGIGAGIPLRAA